MENVLAKITGGASKSLQDLEIELSKKHEQIDQWFAKNWQQTRAPFYCSVDLRNSGYKIAPIDTNLFPAGFNNLNESSVELGSQAAKEIVEFLVPGAEKILLIPESHSRNMMYFENVAALQKILQGAGFSVTVGTLIEGLVKEREIALPSGNTLNLVPVTRKENQLVAGDFIADLVLLNNDMSSGAPHLLQNLEQKVFPPLALGWAYRLKSSHFQFYQNVASEFAEVIGCDSWILTPVFRYCGEIDFLTREGEDCLIRHIDTVLDAVKLKYAEYGIKDQPYVVVKSDSGTYGMSVMTVKDSDEIRQLNRKQRTKMASSKGGQAVSKVIIQEGVYTFETIGEQNEVAEPVMYMIGKNCVGGFYRIHSDKGPDENLNAPGANFKPLAFCEECRTPGHRCYTYSVVARLALLAAARELAEQIT